MENWMNLGALLIQYFCRQRVANSGDIRCGGLVTEIAYVSRFRMPPGNQVMGSKYLDVNHMASTKFLGVYRENNHLRAYQFYFEVNGEIVQELLPFSGDFGLPRKNTWVLSPEELHAVRVAAGRAPAPGRDATWEQHNDQAGDDDQQWGGQGWDDFGQAHQYHQYQ
jgi:hypothetical protein